MAERVKHPGSSQESGTPHWTRSKAGWVLAAGYVLLASILFYRAVGCSGWVCDLAALPAAVPLGFPIAWVTDWIDTRVSIPGHTPTSHFRNWYFIGPTVIANAIFYFGVGRLGGVVFGKLRSGSY